MSLTCRSRAVCWAGSAVLGTAEGAWRYDHVRWRVGLARPGRGIGRLAIVGAVRGQARDGALHCPQQVRHLRRVVGCALRQHVRGDLARAGVHGQVQLHPAPLPAAVLGRVPLPWPNSSSPVLSSTRCRRPLPSRARGWRPAKARPRLLEGRVVRHGQVEAEQAQHAASQTCRLTQGQVEDEPGRQHRLNGQVGVARLTAWRAAARRGARQPASAASSPHSVRSPRRRSPASQAGQFLMRQRAFGMR